MPRQGSPSPARRPQLEQRPSSSHSVSKGSPNAGHLSKSHKGSSTKLHKAHAVGHGRHQHARVPSYGKGLHKLSRLGPGDAGDTASQSKHHARSASDTPTSSPTTQNAKRNSSQISLPRIGSKVSVKKNASNVSMSKLGNHSKSEKTQTKNNLRKNITDDAPLQGTAQFSIGGDGQDEDWEEASGSQSPETTRHSSIGHTVSQLEVPPSPDEPQARSPTNLPQSPPQSPPERASAFGEETKDLVQEKNSTYSHPFNQDEVSHRLLDRSKHIADSRVSNISATATSNASSGSPAFSHNNDPNYSREPSMPADGISRFLSGTGSNSGSATPDSYSHLHPSLPNLSQPRASPDSSTTIRPATRRSISPDTSMTPRRDMHRRISPDHSSTTTANTRRVKSAANLTHSRLSNGRPSSNEAPDGDQSSAKPSSKFKKQPHVSPYESARGADPSAGKSLTQLKLDLQRLSTLHDTPSTSHPLRFQHSSVVSVQNLNAGSSEMAARMTRQYQQAQLEYRNARRFYPDLAVGQHLSKKVVEAKKQAERAKSKSSGTKTPTGTVSLGSSAETTGGRGRVGGGSPEGTCEERSVHGEEGALEDLMRRMWHERTHSAVAVE